jgi:hypothetical protein
MGSFGMVWPKTESTKGEHDARHAASRKNVIRKRSAALTTDSVGQNALAS